MAEAPVVAGAATVNGKSSVAPHLHTIRTCGIEGL
jgi:hypothetical protein